MADDVELTFMQDLPAHADPQDMDILLVNTNGDDKSITLRKVSDYVGKNVGNVKTVNKIAPDNDGDITLTATNVGALPNTGGTVTGEIKSTTGNNYRITAGDRSFFLRYDSNDFYVMKTAAGDPDGIWDDDRPLRIGNDGAVYIEGERPKDNYVTGVRLSGIGTASNGNNDNLFAEAPDGTIVVSAMQKGNYMAVKYRYLQYCINGNWKTVSIS